MQQTTMALLDRALSEHPAPYWHERLSLNRNALHNAKQRGHISPAIAGALAEQLGEDVDKWIVIAALESEKDSACKQRMVRRFSKLKAGAVSRIVEFKKLWGVRRAFGRFAREKTAIAAALSALATPRYSQRGI